MSRLLAALLLIGLAAPTPAHAQASQPSAAQCQALAAYRDSGLYSQWSAAVGSASTYSKAMGALDDAYADVKGAKTKLHMVDAAGALAHTAGALSTLTMNLATGAPVKQLEKGAYQWLSQGKNAVEFVSASDKDRLLMVPQYVTDMIASASGVGRGAIAVRDLALDMKAMTTDLAESAAIRRQLDQQMVSLRRDASQLQGKIAAIDAAMSRIGGIKNAIDQACGSRGCPLAGAASLSRKGAIVCLVSNQAACPGCKDGWRHRCDATSSGLAWRPVDECLPNELKNAKSGTDRQKEASDLFAAQSESFSSIPSDEEKAERRRELQEAMSMYGAAAQRGSADAAARNAAYGQAVQAAGQYNFDGAQRLPTDSDAGPSRGAGEYDFDAVDPEHTSGAKADGDHNCTNGTVWMADPEDGRYWCHSWCSTYDSAGNPVTGYYCSIGAK